MTAPYGPRMIDEHQARAIKVLHARLGRPLPEEGIAHLTFDEAGDLIMALRDELNGRG